MAREISFFKPSGLVLLTVFFFILNQANGSPPSPPVLAGQRLSLQPYFSALEDRTGSSTAANLISHPEAFVPLASLPQGNPVSYYWLRMSFRTNGMDDPGKILAFNHLTFVDTWLYDDTTLVTHKV